MKPSRDIPMVAMPPAELRAAFDEIGLGNTFELLQEARRDENAVLRIVQAVLATSAVAAQNEFSRELMYRPAARFLNEVGVLALNEIARMRRYQGKELGFGFGIAEAADAGEIVAKYGQLMSVRRHRSPPI